MPVLYPNTTIQGKPLTANEVRTLRSWYDSRVKKYSAIDPVLGDNFSRHWNFFQSVFQIAKGKFQQVASFPETDATAAQPASAYRSPQIPQANQIGVQDILPEDVYRNQTGSGSTVGPQTWDINTLVPGTALYLLGDSAPTYFSTPGTEPNRYILGIIQNGLVETGGNTPGADQLFFYTTLNGFNPFTIDSLYRVTEVANKTIYSYDTPGAILLDEVVKAQLTMEPKYAVNTSISFIGVKVYEYNQYTALKY